MANILASDINEWYSQLNTILSNHELETITPPNVFAKRTPIFATQLVAIIDKLGWAKEDRYYSYATYPEIPPVNAGELIEEEVKNSIEATLESIEVTIRCRNDVTNVYGGGSTTGHGRVSYSYTTGNSTSGCQTTSTDSQTTTNATHSKTEYGNKSNDSHCPYAGGATDVKCSDNNKNTKYSQSGDGKTTTTGNGKTTGDGKKTGDGKVTYDNTTRYSTTTTTDPEPTTTIDVSNVNAVTYQNISDSKILP